MLRRLSALSALAAITVSTTAAAAPGSYETTVASVANMVSDGAATRLVSERGLQLLNVLWEDTGRWEGSAVGPNISDVTIEVEADPKTRRTYLMPVMRYDNFTDKTADVRLDKLLIPVGNQRKGGKLELVTLGELLRNPAQYMTGKDKGRIKGGSLFAKRDTHALVSAQHAFLPVPKQGKATFYPVIFNYQSTAKNPAVLTILVTRQGTSISIVDNARDTVGGDSWGQRLYFNKAGEKAPLIAERLTDVKTNGSTANGEDASKISQDANVLMLIQVPLKYKQVARAYLADDGDAAYESAAPTSTPSIAKSGAAPRESDVDVAVLGHGPTQGPYTELDGLTIERDDRFPVRVTLQFYQATSNGVVSRENVQAMASQIAKVYAKGDYVGSLVVPTGLDRARPTNWTGVTTAPSVIWSDFPGLVERFARRLPMTARRPL